MLLAVDTSTAQIGLALYDESQVLGESVWTSGQHHTVELAPALAGLLARCGATMDSVNALGVAIGPGSFTSLRVGLAFAKGITLARRIPLIGIPTMDVLAAAQAVVKIPLVTVLQAGRGRLAVGWYKAVKESWQAEGPARVETVDSLAASISKPTIVCGELNAEERQRLARKRVNVMLVSAAQSVRRPAILAELAWTRWQAGHVDQAASLAPIYLHVAEPVPG
ncbi:MAG TPA: tRNA (adenosine(37)-N6)-threonylcarbamoyltransferase complex dimerization subunit type 1 TsaB [Anaerolineales bacterium]|nr:tRNA (adenosine(37)-N6)-threonylcarbamoyltransferase complex dimerization subunit type 1 TsaB [Anaerolineales bacterium]